MNTTIKKTTEDQQIIHRPDNYHIIMVQSMGATNTQPARIKLISERFKQSIIIPFTNHAAAFSPALDSAILWLSNKGFNIVGQGEGKDHYYLISTTFEPLKTSTK